MSSRRIFFIIIFLILFISSFVFYTNKAFLYSPETTHYNLTQQIIDLYNLTYDPDINLRQAELILKGSLDEDIWPRPIYHLYDPIYNRAPGGVTTAKEWALNYDIQQLEAEKFATLGELIRTEGEYNGNFSWMASIKAYANNDKDYAYYVLGHIIHLIEDMSVPAHTRNDPHPPFIDTEPYEKWANDNNGLIDFNIAEPLYKKGYRPANFYTLGEYFDNLAKYSNKYFFSKDTILSKDYISPEIVKEIQEDYGRYSQRTYGRGKDENGNLFRLVEVRILWLENEKTYLIDETDQNLNHDYWARLAPKAVIYGAGVIRLFIKEVEWQKKLAQQKEPEPSFFQKAQTFVKNLLGIGEEEKKSEPEYMPGPLPQPKPMRFPDAGPLVLAPGESIEQPLEEEEEAETKEKQSFVSPEDKETVKGEVKGAQREDQVEDKGEKTGTVVKGPKTGGSGGISWKEIEEAKQQAVGGEGGSEEEQEESEEEEQPEQEPEPQPHLVINEVQVKDNEFVELYNPTETAISLASYSFCYYSSNRDWNDPYRNKVFPETASISAGGYYLIGLKGYPEEEGNPDADWQVYESNQLSNSTGSVAIFPWDPSERTASEAQPGAIDAVAWGDVENVIENIPFQETMGTDKSMQRKEDSQDTDDNNTDFELQKIPSPTNSNGEERTLGTFIPDHTIISEDTVWTIAGSPYYIESNAGQWPIVEVDFTLTIEPGVVIIPLNANYTFLEIRGTLKAEGTINEKIFFTSQYDTDYGGVGSASAGDWKNMIFSDTSIDSVFDYVIFRYGGHPNSEMIKVEGSSIEIKNSIIENSQTNGIYLKNSNSSIKDSIISDNQIGVVVERGNSEIKDCQIKDNSKYGIGIKNGAKPEIKDNSFSNNLIAAVYFESSYPKFSNNQVSNNGLNGILVSSQTIINQHTSWQADLTYVLESNKGQAPTVASGSILTLEQDVILKPMSQYYTALLIEGTLVAEAASGSEIVITSLKDDSFGGDTNNDGDSTVPANGDWENIKFTASSAGSVLDHMFIYYGSGNPVFIEPGADVDVKHVDFEP